MKYRSLHLPLKEKDVCELRAGDRVLLSGKIITARDMAHRWMAEEKPDEIRPDLYEGALYHCGPIMLLREGTWICRSAGPTSSTRQEPYQSDIIREYKIRCIIGKGGMGKKTAEALKTYNAVYLNATGGAAVMYANTVRTVEKVYRLDEFGMPEALWVMQVEDFPAIVSMDTLGHSLHRYVEEKSRDRIAAMILK